MVNVARGALAAAGGAVEGAAAAGGLSAAAGAAGAGRLAAGAAQAASSASVATSQPPWRPAIPWPQPRPAGRLPDALCPAVSHLIGALHSPFRESAFASCTRRVNLCKNPRIRLLSRPSFAAL